MAFFFFLQLSLFYVLIQYYYQSLVYKLYQSVFEHFNSLIFLTLMHYPSYFQKTAQTAVNYKMKAQQNKPNTMNTKKGYQEDQDSYIIKGCDTFQVKDLKGKMKIMMQKLGTNRKQKQQLQKQNQNLQKQIITLRNNVRHMIPGFSNTSSTFPMSNELIAKLLEFYKYECLDRFFQNLCPQQLSMKGVIYFYHYSFTQIMELINQYFEETFFKIKQTGCFDTLEGPVMNVLRKSYQVTYDKILSKIVGDDSALERISSTLINKLSLASQEKQDLMETLVQFLKKLLELALFCKISDPPLNIEIQSIGKKIKYNSIFNDPLDGFIKNKQQCWVVLPQIRKTQNQEVLVKSLVLKTDYFEQENQEQHQDNQNYCKNQ